MDSVSIDWVPPFDIDHSDHNSNESKEDDVSSDYIKDENFPSSEVNRVNCFESDSKVQVEESNNDRDLFFGSVHECQLI